MQPERNASFPTSIDTAAGRTAAADAASDGSAMLAPALRLVLGAWAAGIYLVYWLGYLGLR